MRLCCLSLRHNGTLGIGRLAVALFHQCRTFCKKLQAMQKMTLAEVQVKQSVILMDRLGPDIFSMLQMEGHVLHRPRTHLKVSG